MEGLMDIYSELSVGYFDVPSEYLHKTPTKSKLHNFKQYLKFKDY